MIKLNTVRYCLPLLLIALIGCGESPPPPQASLSESLHELQRICKEENNLDVIIKPVGRTVWIYMPLEVNFLEMKATPAGPQSSDQPSVKPSIKFLEGWFSADKIFHIKHDIGPSKGYAKDYGYASNFAQEYQDGQRNILSAVSRAYANFQESPGEGRLVANVAGDREFNDAKQNASHQELAHAYVPTETAPDFFVIVMADIVNGLESTVVFHLRDLLRAFADASFYEEYARRVISEQPVGNAAIIGDRDGRHIEYSDIAWGDFLARQMVYRINFKYQRSAFPPSEDTRSELLTIAADTVSAYTFKDFRSLRLHDLNGETDYEITPSDLAAYKTETTPGRLIHIKFQ